LVQHLNEINQLEMTMQQKKDAMVKARKEYVKAWKEAQAAHAKHMKADHNMDISRAELEKARHNALVKGQASEDAKNNYAHVLQVANQQQKMHYAELLPNVLEVCSTAVHKYLKMRAQKLRCVDEERVRSVGTLIERCVDVEAQTIPIVHKCLQDMRQHARAVNPGARVHTHRVD
jgi:hypothetical protein